MHVDYANIDNLTRLWQVYGCEAIALEDNKDAFININWPNRLWQFSSIRESDILQFSALSRSPLWVHWPYIDKQDGALSAFTETNQLDKVYQQHYWQCVLKQTAMYLDLKLQDNKSISVLPKSNFIIKKLTSNCYLNDWIDVVKDSFGYSVDQHVIEKALTHKDTKFYLGLIEGKPIASSLLFKTGNIVGLHQVGVKADYQGQGFARPFMQAMIKESSNWQASHMVLQASQAGKPLYDRLGFISQFMINSYQRVN